MDELEELSVEELLSNFDIDIGHNEIASNLKTW